MSRDEQARAGLAAFAAFPSRLAAAVREAIDRPVPAGDWTPNQVVRHLIAVEPLVVQRRLRDLAAGSGARWGWAEPPPWDGDPWLTKDELLDRFANARAETVALARSLDDETWARTGTHEVYGELDGDGLVRLATSHDEEHLAAILGHGPG